MAMSKEDALDKRIDKLGQVVEQQSKAVNSLGDYVKAINEYVKAVRGKGDILQEGVLEVLEKIDEKVNVISSAMEAIGKNRKVDCVYSRNGYCENINNTVGDPSKENRNTTKIKGIYYPQIGWIDCYLCSYYEVPPSEIPDS